MRIHAQLEVGLAQQRRDDGRLRRCLRIVQASVVTAEAAEIARSQLASVFILVGGRCVPCWQREGFVAQALCGGGEQSAGWVIGKRRQRVFAGAIALERVAPFNRGALDVARLARRAAHIFEAVEVRLELIVSDAPVLQVHVCRDEFLAIPLLHPAVQAQLVGAHPRLHTGPVRTRAADPFARFERAELAIRQSDIVLRMADRDCGLREVLEQRLPARNI